MLHISTGPAHSWEVDFRATDSVTLNGQPFLWDIGGAGRSGRYHVLHQGKSYSAELVSADYATKAFVLKINGQRMELQAKDRFDQLLDRLGLSDATAKKVNELKAPCPASLWTFGCSPAKPCRRATRCWCWKQ